MSNFYQKTCGIMLVMLLSISSLFAQQTVTGRVTDAEGPLQAVSITVVGSTTATQTNANGNYSIQANNGATLRFTIVGYASKDVLVSGTTHDVTLESGSGDIDEVVVTAMGIKREKKSLGYSFQEVKSETLVDARENNIANALSGKVSGLQVIKGSNGPASSSKIVLRGFSSITGDNQPLIVVDGVPMENFAGAKNNDFWGPTPDMGSGLGDLNPDDIESMSVLKGGAASALYGSRASSGVILITTKSGKKQDGAGITYSATMGIENLFITPSLQNEFSQGRDGSYSATSSDSWGEKISGQSVEAWDKSTRALKTYDNISNFFETGVNTSHHLAFQQMLGDHTNIYSSATYLHDKSKTPGSKLDRLNFITKATSNFGANKRWTTDVKVQYMNNTAHNRPAGGANDGNNYATTLILPRTVDIRDFKDGMNVLGANQTWYNSTNEINPFWSVNNRLNKDSRDRFLLNASVKYRFNDWLDADVRAGSDLYTTKHDNRAYTGSPMQNNYGTGMDNFYENNFIASVNARKDNIVGKWSASASVFGQIMKQNFKSITGSTGELQVPNLFTLGNAVGNPEIDEQIRKMQINSLFATAEINYDNFWFVNVTGRNDWSSTLLKENRSYFYPSVSTSLVITDMINRTGGQSPSWLNFAKVRASYAETGNSLRPYQLYNVYNIGKDPNGNTTASKDKTKYNPEVINELLKSFEVGFDVRLFNRINLDFAYYKSNATNQLIEIPMNSLSGYDRFMANAGKIQNKGFEVMLGANILKNPDKFMWDMNVNFSRNINDIIELLPELDVESMELGGFDNVKVEAAAGQRYGAIYGSKFNRVEDRNSQYYGQMILNGNGLPTEATDAEGNKSFYLGNQSAKALLGVTNSFAYKNFGLSFLVDARLGGQFFAGTNQRLQRAGVSAETVVNGAREDFVVAGVVSDGAGGYVENTTKVTHQQYWTQVTTASGNLGIAEQNIYDATNIRLRNVQLSYSLPKSMLGKSVVKNARFSLSANNVWMIKSHANGIDPESVFAISTNAVGFENLAVPTSRSYFLNISLGF